MEVMIPVSSTMDFDFNSSRPAPFLSTPSTPKRVGEFYFSAPTSPSRVSDFYREFDNFSTINESSNGVKTKGSPSGIPFYWEEKPGTPKSPSKAFTSKDDDFVFDFCVELEKTSLSAEELFDGGKIRPLKPPPGFIQSPVSPRSLRSPKKILQSAFSPKQRKVIDPFAAVVENTRKKTGQGQERGRERLIANSSSSSSSGRRAARSLSPLRVSSFPWDQEEQQQDTQQPSTTSKSKSSRISKLKDFLLFRSASEGRATEKDPFKKYADLSSKRHEDIRNSSFRSTDSSGSGSGSGSRRRGKVSAHELHYTMNRAVSEDMKKKTFLPYKQGILGRLAINPAVSALSNGFGFTKA